MTLRRKNSKNNRKQELRLTEEEKQHILNRRKLMAKKDLKEIHYHNYIFTKVCLK